MSGVVGRLPCLRPAVVLGIALSFFAIVGADARSARVEREVAGRGVDDMAAILSALQEATFQICGVRIRSSLGVRSRQIEDDDGVRMTESINRDIRSSTAKRDCEIDGYDVLDVSDDGAGARATLRVRYTVYRVPGPSMERRRIAVLAFPMEDVHLYGVGGGRDGLIDGRVSRLGIGADIEILRSLEEEFAGRVEELLTQSRRFGVLDRKRADVYEAEKALLKSGDAGPGERARLGKLLGADYLLYGTIDRVIVEDRSKTIEITGERKQRLIGAVDLRFTVLATATRQVKWSSSIALDRVFSARLRPEAAAASVLHAAAAALVDEATENIYPPKVAAVVAADRFVVNRGGNTVVPGDLFEVFATGERLIDPDTREPLDRIEKSVGIARIVDVKPKHSVAELVSGPAELSRGMVLRRRTVDAEIGSGQDGRRPIFRDRDDDGLPDYLNRL